MMIRRFFSVHHLKNLDSSIPLSQFLVKQLSMNSNDEALELIQLGSVYFRSSDSKEPTQRVLNDQIISSGDYVRVYANTTRYNIHSIDWRKTIIYDSPDFVVVDKPPGISTHPTVGNFRENVSECIRECLGIEKIYLPHRLDADTSGLLIFGKTLSFAQQFSKAAIQKTYRSLLTWRSGRDDDFSNNSLPSLGATLTHYMENRVSHPRFLHVEPVEGGKICLSKITRKSNIISLSIPQWEEKIREYEISNPHLASALKDWIFPFHTVFDYYRATKTERFLPPPHEAHLHDELISFCEVELELLTGRTHQLRAQMQMMGSGIQIAGDKIYHTYLPGALPSCQVRSQLKPQFISSPHLALQPCSIFCDDSPLLENKKFELSAAFWTPLFNNQSNIAQL